MTATYDVGDRPVITATFAPIDGETGTSTAVTFTVRDPNGVETEYTNDDDEVDADGDNVWVLTMPRIDTAGGWSVRAESTAGIQAAVEAKLTVRRSHMTDP